MRCLAQNSSKCNDIFHSKFLKNVTPFLKISDTHYNEMPHLKLQGHGWPKYVKIYRDMPLSKPLCFNPKCKDRFFYNFYYDIFLKYFLVRMR